MTAAYRFGRFELQPSQRRLLADDRPIPLGQRAFDVLSALIERRERLVPKNELLDVVWPGLVVEENNLQVQVSSLRKVLGANVIATIPGRGYRFTAPLDGSREGGKGVSAPRAIPVTPQADSRAPVFTNLPKLIEPLYGREADLPALRALIEAHRLVTVVGAGGIGKSRLAQAAAHSFIECRSDGAWMVELAGLSDPALLPNTVAQTLGITMGAEHASVDELIAGLAQRMLLLVLDNCEHLLDATAALVRALLLGAPGVTLLTTSQEPLHLPGEQQYRLLPLAVPAETTVKGAFEFGAVALFEARVRAVDPHFTMNDENLAVVIDICRRLDGLPLAIELAAARVATLGLRPVRDRLDARFKLLTGGSRTTLRRHQTLRAALEWSHNLLDDDEQAVFRRLGVFAGGFTVELAQAVASDDRIDEWAVLDHLSTLVDKSLVVAGTGDAPRYRLLESTRAFALEQVAASETAEILRRHALAMRNFLKRVDDANLDGELRTDQYAAMVLPELDNLRAAYVWAGGEGGDRRVAVELAAYAGSLIDYALECADWLMPLRQHVQDGAVDAAAAARFWRAVAASNMTHHVSIDEQVEAACIARDAYQALGQPRRVFSSLIQLSRHCDHQGHAAEAQAALDDTRRLLQPDWPPEFRIQLLRRDGWAARTDSLLSEALAINREVVRLSASSGDWRLEVIARANLVDSLWQLGPIDEAAREALKLAEELRAKPTPYVDMEVLFANLIGILSEMRRIDEASAAAREALPMMRHTGDTFLEEWIYLFWLRGQADVAVLLLGAFEAKLVRTEQPVQPNEQRLIAAARAGLADQMRPDAFAHGLKAGAALTQVELFASISDALARAAASVAD